MAELVETNGDFSGYDITRQRLLETYLFNMAKDGAIDLYAIEAFEAALAAGPVAMNTFIDNYASIDVVKQKIKATIATAEQGYNDLTGWRKIIADPNHEAYAAYYDILARNYGVSGGDELLAAIDQDIDNNRAWKKDLEQQLEDPGTLGTKQAEIIALFSGYLGFEKGMIESLKRQDLNMELFLAMEERGTTAIMNEMFDEGEELAATMGENYAKLVAQLSGVKSAELTAVAFAYGDALAEAIIGDELYTSMLYLLAYFKELRTIAYPNL